MTNAIRPPLGTVKGTDGPPTAADDRRPQSPFVTIGPLWRVALIAYVLLYMVLLPGLREVLASSPTPLLGWRFSTSAIHSLLVFLPILFYRREYGWLHPLIFPTVWGLAREMISSPEQLLSPWFLIDTPTEQHLSHTALAGWSQHDIALGMLKADLVAILGLSLYYTGFFFAPTWRVPRPELRRPRGVASKALLLVGFSVLVLLLFMQMRGGILNHMIGFGSGRFRALGGSGPMIVLVRLGTVAVVTWYALEKRAIYNPLFWGAGLYVLLSGFVMSGSRSSILFTVAIFGMIWMLRHRTLPAVRVVAGALAIFVLFGLLGQLRTSTFRGDVDLSLLTEFSFVESLRAADREAGRRAARSAHAAVIAKVPGDVPLLLGRTYVAAVLFFVPRAIWEGKPRGAGAMTAAYIFGNQEFGTEARRGGIPPGDIAEAYWNFHLPGVIIIFLLFGMFHRWLVRTYTSYSGAPAIMVLYVLTVLLLSPSTIAIVSYFHHVIPALAILWWMRAITFRPLRMGREYVA